MHRDLGHPDALVPGGNGGMQIGQCLAVIQPGGLGHETIQQGQHPIRAVLERMEQAMRVWSLALPSLIEKTLDTA